MSNLKYNLNVLSNMMYNNSGTFRLFYDNKLVEFITPLTIELLLDSDLNKLKAVIDISDRTFHGSTQTKYRWFKDDVFQVENVDDIFYNDTLDNMDFGSWTCKISAKFGGIYSQDIISEEFSTNFPVVENVLISRLEEPYISKLSYDFVDPYGFDEDKINTLITWYISDITGDTNLTQVATQTHEYQLTTINIDKYLSVKITPVSLNTINNIGLEKFFQFGQITTFQGIIARNLMTVSENLILDAADDVVYDWRLNGTSVTILNLEFAESSNIAKDYSSYNHTPIIIGDVAYNATGGENDKSAAYFINTIQNPADNYIYFNNISNYSLNDSTLVAKWFSLGIYTNNQWIVGRGRGNSRQAHALGAYTPEHKPSFWIGNGTNKRYNITFVDNGNDIWTSASGKRKGQLMTLRSNGETESYTLPEPCHPDITYPVIIGARRYTGPFYEGMNGYIEKAKIYTRALSINQEELEELDLITHWASEEQNIGEKWSVVATPIINGIASTPLTGFDYVHLPEALNVTMDAFAMNTGRLATASYEYRDLRGDDEANSIIKWYESDTAEGPGTLLSTGKEIIIPESTSGKYLILSVTAVSVATENNIGEAVIYTSNIITSSGITVTEDTLSLTMDVSLHTDFITSDYIVYDWRKDNDSIALGNFPLYSLDPVVKNFSSTNINATNHNVTSLADGVDSAIGGKGFVTTSDGKGMNYDIPNLKDKWSLSLFMKPDDVNSGLRCIYRNNGYSYQINSDIWVNGFGSTTNVFNAGTWVHIVYVYDPTISKNGVYIDGIYNETNDLSSKIPTGTIGYDGYSQQFRGVIDNIQMYDRALSSEQVNVLTQLNFNKIALQELHTGESWRCVATPIKDGVAGYELYSNIINI